MSQSIALQRRDRCVLCAAGLVMLSGFACGSSFAFDDAPAPIAEFGVLTGGAMGPATRIQRDLIGRPTRLGFADGKATTLRYDLARTSIGYLSEIVDRSGTTAYTHNVFGRVVRLNGTTTQVQAAASP